MQQEVYNACNLGGYTTVNSTILANMEGPITLESMVQLRADLSTLVNTGLLRIRHNNHLQMGLPNPANNVPPQGNAVPYFFYTPNTLQIEGRKVI